MKKENKRIKRRGLGFGKTIKCVVPVEKDEFEGNGAKVLQTVKCAVDRPKGYYGHCVFKFLNGHDELVEREFTEMKIGKDSLRDAFAESTTIMPVRIQYENGDWEYGLKCLDSVVVNSKVLKSYYVKVGLIDDADDKNKLDLAEMIWQDSERIQAWILELLPRCNESTREMLELVDWTDHKKKWRGLSVGDWASVWSVFSSGHIATDIELKKMSIDGNPERLCPVNVECRRTYEGFPMMTTWKDNHIVNESASIVYKNEEPVFSTYLYSYLKSFYGFKSRHVHKYTLIPISSLLTIVDRKSRLKEGDDEVELWNNIDETVKGNL